MELEVVPALTLAVRVQLKALYLEALLYGVKLSQSEYYNFFSALWLYALNSQYCWKWTNANPMKIFSRAATASKL